MYPVTPVLLVRGQYVVQDTTTRLCVFWGNLQKYFGRHDAGLDLRTINRGQPRTPVMQPLASVHEVQSRAVVACHIVSTGV